MRRLNEFRREHPALQSDWSLTFHPTDNEHLIAYSKRRGDEFLDRHVTNDDTNPLAQLQDHRMREALVEAIKKLPEREQYVMSMYYEHDMNLREIAAVLKVTESRVCQLHSQSIARLRVKLRDF